MQNLHQQLYLMMRGQVSQMTPEQRQQIALAEADLQDFLRKHGDAGTFAVALKGAELAAQE